LEGNDDHGLNGFVATVSTSQIHRSDFTMSNNDISPDFASSQKNRLSHVGWAKLVVSSQTHPLGLTNSGEFLFSPSSFVSAFSIYFASSSSCI
jgi:hypothetical protein